MFLITIYTDLRLRRLIERPIEFMELDGYGRVLNVTTIPKEAILCDACGSRVAVEEKEVEEEGLKVGYALCDEEAVFEVVCQDCRNKYFSGLKAFKTLEEVGL